MTEKTEPTEQDREQIGSIELKTRIEQARINIKQRYTKPPEQVDDRSPEEVLEELLRHPPILETDCARAGFERGVGELIRQVSNDKSRDRYAARLKKLGFTPDGYDPLKS